MLCCVPEPADSDDSPFYVVATAPKEIKTFINRLTLGFDDAESIPETESLTLSEKDLAPNAVVPLRFVRYQSVNSIVLFIKSNQGDEESTVLKQLVFYGSPIETTKVRARVPFCQ
jgi:hypothetical protein